MPGKENKLPSHAKTARQIGIFRFNPLDKSSDDEDPRLQKLNDQLAEFYSRWDPQLLRSFNEPVLLWPLSQKDNEFLQHKNVLATLHTSWERFLREDNAQLRIKAPQLAVEEEAPAAKL